jgi:Tol biopolymer transport system component
VSAHECFELFALECKQAEGDSLRRDVGGRGSGRGGTYEIWTIDAEGINLRQLTFNSPPNTSFPDWSPDGKRLLYRKAVEPGAGGVRHTHEKIFRQDELFGPRFAL